MNSVKKHIFLFLFLINTLFSFAQVDLAHTVNPFIGTGGHGHTFPGAVMPFGMVQLSPDTRVDGSWDGCSGYHYSDSTIYGFSHTHLSGTGVSDWGDILIIPSNEDKGLDSKKYATTYSHKNEKAHAGFYSVKLNNKIEAELTTTNRVGIHRYKFNGAKAFIVLDLLHRDKVIQCDLSIIDSVTIVGYRNSEAWAKEQHCYFTMKLSKPIKRSLLAKSRSYVNSEESLNKDNTEKILLEFDNSDKKPLIIKLALSNVDNIGSSNNLFAEAKHWDFDAYTKEAEDNWNMQLQKIRITESDQDKRFVFYTALYHCFIHPSLDMDIDQRYRGRDNKIHVAKDYTHYNVFSLWDTYRALHPLFTLIEQKRTNDFINTFFNQYQEGKKLPVWELSSNETNCMIGYHSVSVITDAFVKGLKNYDTLAIYKAMKESAMNKEFSIQKFYSKKFLEVNDESESVSKSLEYAYDNWCIAEMGKRLNDKLDVPQLVRTSQAYKNLFDASTGFMRPRSNGNWYSPFYPNEINNHYTEGNSWHYSFYVPHDINGLINLHGTEKNFEMKLDELFSTSSKTLGRDQADVTGLIGQYAHGNEPSHHSPFLYHYIGKPNKTSQRVTQILNTFYKNTPDGLIGNDDCGQMSAWYVLASIGMYQVCPGNTQFVMFQPAFIRSEMAFENGKNLVIESQHSPNQITSGYNFNGSFSKQSYLHYDQMLKGGTLHYEYTLPASGSSYGLAKDNRPLSKVNDHLIIPTPIISYKSKTFNGITEVKMKAINGKAEFISYSVNKTQPTRYSKKYGKAIFVSNSTQIKAKAYLGKDSSETSIANLFRLNTKQIVKVLSKTNPQYSADGGQSLMDGVFGDTDWRKGDWLGCQGKDFECVIQNKDTKAIRSLSANFLQDTRSWIVFPKSVTFYTSVDGIDYKVLATVANDIAAKDYTTQIKKLSVTLQQAQVIKFLKVVATNYGTLPEWHDGKGGEAFIFIDEIEMN